MSNEPRIPLPRREPEGNYSLIPQEKPKSQPKVQSEANSTAAKLFGLTVAICASACVVMLTIALGLHLFG